MSQFCSLVMILDSCRRLKTRPRIQIEQGQVGKCVLQWLIYCFFSKELSSLVTNSVTIKMKCVKLLNDAWVSLVTQGGLQCVSASVFSFTEVITGLLK